MKEDGILSRLGNVTIGVLQYSAYAGALSYSEEIFNGPIPIWAYPLYAFASIYAPMDIVIRTVFNTPFLYLGKSKKGRENFSPLEKIVVEQIEGKEEAPLPQ